MIDKITEIFGNVSNEDYKSFNDKINSIINFTRTTENVSRDFSWVPIVEETIPYLDTIIRNPKKFLQQEEDIVIVEKSKKNIYRNSKTFSSAYKLYTRCR